MNALYYFQLLLKGYNVSGDGGGRDGAHLPSSRFDCGQRQQSTSMRSQITTLSEEVINPILVFS